MIISANSEPNRKEFNSLLDSTLIELSSQVNKSPKSISKLLGRDLEPYIKDVMSDLAIGTSFENSIELIGGQKFPDIVAKKYYGIEVKTTTGNEYSPFFLSENEIDFMRLNENRYCIYRGEKRKS